MITAAADEMIPRINPIVQVAQENLSKTNFLFLASMTVQYLSVL